MELKGSHLVTTEAIEAESQAVLRDYFEGDGWPIGSKSFLDQMAASVLEIMDDYLYSVSRKHTCSDRKSIM
jgi:hypothetical protein